MTAALANIEKIKNLFLETQQLYAMHGAGPKLTEHLQRADKAFSSVAFESASMSIALASFTAGAFPRDWLAFANGPAAAHRAQVYVGLGWAIAKSERSFETVVRETDPHFASRVADGCGYYDGSFRRRQTVQNQQFPAYLPDVALPMYDQGVGRSLWYTEETDLTKVHGAIETFPVARHPDLWRGLGIAVAYVGGCEDAALKLLFQSAGAHGAQLTRGAALAVESRTAANTMTDDTLRCSRLWGQLA